MSRRLVPSVALLGLLLATWAFVAGCSGGSNTGAFFTVSERCSYGPTGLVAFAAFGGNGLRYIHTINERGGSVNILTPSRNDPQRTDEGGWQPAFSPDGSRIAMTSKRPGEDVAQVGAASEDIFLIAAAGGEKSLLLKLTDDPASDQQANWSPDGSQLVFTSDRTGSNDIFVMGADGSAEASVALLTDPADDQWACFNPQDADDIAFQSDRAEEGNTDIWALLGGTLANLTADSPARDEHPAWSPDGTRILFTSNRSGDFDIWSVNPADPSDVVQVTPQANSDGYPNWRPNGARIVVTRDRQVWTTLPDGSDQKQLTRTF